MPLHIFRCANGHETELLVPMEHARWQNCPECEMMACQVPSTASFTLSWSKAAYDVKDPFKEIKSLEGKAGPNPLTYKSDKVFVDHGKD
jgi:hypothetical protein